LDDETFNPKTQKAGTQHTEVEPEIDAVNELLEIELKTDENWTDGLFKE
jgi:hypothetical protein